MDENRSPLRRRVLKGGVIEFGGGAIDCTVRNFSETGAALSVQSVVGIPSKFNLIMGGARCPQRCRIVWRKENRIGIAFRDQ
ncbi:PilZ domain-containing protein [Tardiphaga sp. vice352]|uniref:PilZ domain-containing protein n=1 Tax=unclassified Tardiphaga TaxID=2631404 RepID=UPI00116541DD|nr:MULTISPECIES: PilZ domain-containing protein [unclassified Tardiphaga]QDM14568.1 PilZ domain-containing protein [Tardiphaga sp. vice278]QDM24765.1 PilZ domain-containing protein [Tardiphaga sp. vice304]QDM29958.1 PilZ domain-containing protein [Tardiphaga sp. vice352]